jgi:hypothetical protein
LPDTIIDLLGLERPKKAPKVEKGKGKGKARKPAGKKGKGKVWDPGQITDGAIPLDEHTKVGARQNRSSRNVHQCGRPQRP